MATKVWILLALSLVSGISAQDYCFTDDWFIEIGGCFLQKYVDMLGGIPFQSQSVHDTRRSLQSMALFDPQVNIVGNTKGVQTTIERLASKAKRMQENYLSDDIMDAVLQKIRKLGEQKPSFNTKGMDKEMKKGMKILEKITKVDADNVINKVAGEAVSTGYQIHSALLNFLNSEELNELLEKAKKESNVTLSNNNQYNSPYAQITESFEQLAETLREIRLLIQGACLIFPLPDIICSGVPNILRELERVLTCFFDRGFNETHFEDGIEWMGCIYECSDLPGIWQCIRSASSTCDSPVVGDLLLEVAAEYIFGLGECRLQVTTPPFGPVEVTEGETGYELEVSSYMPHTLYCLDMSQINTPIGMIALLVALIQGPIGECPVEIQVSTQNYLYPILSLNIGSTPSGWPRCQSGPLVNQALIGRHDYQEGDCSCSVVLNGDTWNQTFTFPIQAAIDNKMDGNVEGQLTVKLRVKGFIVQTHKIEMNIIDRDLINPVCASLGDPHISSFNGVNLDNYEEGYFELYQHQSLPYEVQVIQQNCSVNIGASCTCAVAVRTGDDVFKVDRCRVEGSDDVPPTIVVMYLNGELNPGTRIFSKENGNKFEIVLPTGTIVTMSLGAENSINVWIQASAYDRTSSGFPVQPAVLGLCGTYDEDDTNDRLKPDGNDAADDAEFIESWSVAEEDQIFFGAAEDSSLPTLSEKCKCSFMIAFGVQCDCGYNLNVDLCDFDTTGEMTTTIQMVSRQSEKERWLQGLPSTWLNRTVDINIGSSPDDGTGVVDVTVCSDAVLNDPEVADCIANVIEFENATVQNEIDGCAKDMSITGTTDFVAAAVESARLRCTIMKSQGTGVLSSLGASSSYTNNDCVNDCNNHGVCKRGSCRCNAGYAGLDCSGATQNTPNVTGPALTMCDTRGSSCEYTTVIGYGFTPGNVTCYVQQNELTSNGQITAHIETRQTAYGNAITTSQIACQLPTLCLLSNELCEGSQAFGGVFQIEIQGSSVQPEVLMYDSTCYACSISPSTSCVLKDTSDYCVISSTCFGNHTFKPDDSCYWCDPTTSTSEWSLYKLSKECVDQHNKAIEDENEAARQDTIRLVVACTLSGTVVLVAVILFFTIGRLKKVKSNDAEANASSDLERKTSVKGDNAYDFITETGVTLVRSKPNGEVNDGFDFEGRTYDNAAAAGTSDGKNGEAILY